MFSANLIFLLVWHSTQIWSSSSSSYCSSSSSYCGSSSSSSSTSSSSSSSSTLLLGCWADMSGALWTVEVVLSGLVAASGCFQYPIEI